MNKTEMNIKVSQEVYDLAKSGELNVITSHLDPSATYMLTVEKLQPTTVSVTVAIGNTKPIIYEVKGVDRVLHGYKVSTIRGRILYQLDKPAGRVIIGEQVTGDKVTRPATSEDKGWFSPNKKKREKTGDRRRETGDGYVGVSFPLKPLLDVKEEINPPDEEVPQQD